MLNGGPPMSVIMFGSKTFVVENSTAARILNDAAELKQAGDDASARMMLSLAVKVENGIMSAAEAEGQLTTQSLAA